MEDRNFEKMWPGHGTCWSEMELKIDEPPKSSLPVKQWMIGADQQSLKSKVDSFSEILRSPVQCLRTHDDVCSPGSAVAFHNTTLYSVKRHPLEGIPRDSTSSQTKVLQKQTKTDSEKVIFPQRAGRQDCKSYEQATLCCDDETTESAVHRVQNCISNTELHFSSVESSNKISPLDLPSVSHVSSLKSNVLSLGLHNEVSPSSKCKSHTFSPGGTQVLSAELLEFCSPVENNAVGLTEICAVESLLQDRENDDLGKMRNMEGVKDLPIQTNAEEEQRRLPADSASAAPLPGLPPITPVDSSCAFCPSSAEDVEESRSTEDCEAGLSFTSVKAGEALQTQHNVLHLPGSHFMKGPNSEKTEEEGGAGVMSARKRVCEAKPEMKTIEKFRVGINLRKGAKEEKEKEKTGERVSGPLTVTRAKTRGRLPTAVPELLIKVPYSSLDSTGKVESKTQKKATCKRGFVSETESGREMEKDIKSPEQCVAAPVMGTDITQFNKSALHFSSSHRTSALHTELHFSSVPVESSNKISSLDLPSVSHGSSLKSNVLSPALHNEVSPSSKCNSHPFSPGGIQVMSAELLKFCSPLEKNAVKLTEICAVESSLQDRENDLGKVRNTEGVKDLPIQRNAEEEQRRLPADSASAAPLPGLPPITPVDSSCASSAEDVEESRSIEDCEAGVSLTSVKAGEALQTQHKVLHSPGFHFMKGPNPGKTEEEGGAGVMSARQSVCEAKPEMKTIEKFRVGINLRKAAKEKKEKEKTGERVSGPLTVTRAKTRGRLPTAVPELLINVPYSSLDSTEKVESKNQNKATCKRGFVSETESGGEMEKDIKSPEQCVAAPVMGTDITHFNKSALHFSSSHRTSALHTELHFSSVPVESSNKISPLDFPSVSHVSSLNPNVLSPGLHHEVSPSSKCNSHPFSPGGTQGLSAELLEICGPVENNAVGLTEICAVESLLQDRENDDLGKVRNMESVKDLAIQTNSKEEQRRLPADSARAAPLPGLPPIAPVDSSCALCPSSAEDVEESRSIEDCEAGLSFTFVKAREALQTQHKVLHSPGSHFMEGPNPRKTEEEGGAGVMSARQSVCEAKPEMKTIEKFRVGINLRKGAKVKKEKEKTGERVRGPLTVTRAKTRGRLPTAVPELLIKVPYSSLDSTEKVESKTQNKAICKRGFVSETESGREMEKDIKSPEQCVAAPVMGIDITHFNKSALHFSSSHRPSALHTELHFSSVPVESSNKISHLDFPSDSHGSSLKPNVLSPGLHNEVSPSSKCDSHPFSPGGTQGLSAELLEICSPVEKNAVGLTEICAVESLLQDRENDDLGKVRNMEGVKDLPIQTNSEEEQRRLPADSASAAPLPGLPPITPVDSSCALCPSSAEDVEESRSMEDCEAGLSLTSVMAGEALQTQHKVLHSPGYHFMEGPNPRKTEERGAGVMSARQSVCEAKPEMKTIEKCRVGINIRKGAKEKKEKEKTGERVRAPLTVTRAKTRGRLPTAVPELLIKGPYSSLDSTEKMESKTQNKATFKRGFVSETESGREMEKDIKSEQFVTAPLMGTDITHFNKSALHFSSSHRPLALHTELHFSSVPVESSNKISPLDFPSVSHRSSLKPNVLSPGLHHEVSTSSKCDSHPFSPGGTQGLSAELLEICSPVEKNAVGLTEICAVESLLQDRENDDLGKVRNMEDIKDLPIQTNAEEEQRRLPADSASAAPLPGLPPITPVDSSCAFCPSSAEDVEESRSIEDSEAGLSLTFVKAGEALQTQHKVLHSPGSHFMKGPNPGKTEEEGGAGVMSARQSVCEAKPEMKTIEKFRVGINIRKGAKEKKEKEKTGERVRGPLTVTRAKTRGRLPTAVPELLIKVPYSSLDSTEKVESKTQNKATCKRGFVSETESGGEMEKYIKSPEQFVAAPVMGTDIIHFNKSALDLKNNCDYSCLIRSGDKTKVSRTRRRKTMDNIGCGLNSSINARSNRMGKGLSEAELGSSAVVDNDMWSSKHSTTQSAKTTGFIQREEKEGEINNMFVVKELTKTPELGVRSGGHQFYQNRKRIIEIPSVGNSQFSYVQVSQSEMTGESQGNETCGQRNEFQTGMMLQKGNQNNALVKDAKEEGSHEDIGNEVAKGDEDGILCSRDFQKEWVSEQEAKNVDKTYLKEAYKIRPVSAQGKERYESNTSSKSYSVLSKTQGLLQSTDKPSNIPLESEVDCKNLKGNTIQEFTQISLTLPADMRPLIPDYWSGKSVSMQNDKEANEEGRTTPGVSIHSMDTLPKSKKRKSSRKAGTHRKKDRYSRTGEITPIVVKESQMKDNLVRISGGSPLRSYLKRRHSYPVTNPLLGGPQAMMLASSPLGKLPCSALPRRLSVKRARRHTVCSLEVEREIAPLCLRKEVYPVVSGRLCGSHFPNLISSPKTLASFFLVSPQAFLSSRRQSGSGNIACSCVSSHDVTSSSPCSFATPTPSCPATSSICHPLFPTTISSVPTVHQSSASVSSFCSAPSLRIDEHKLKQEDEGQNRCFRLELDVQERREEMSLSESEIKMESMKQQERGKVSQVKIRKSRPKPPTNLTPMGLPKPVRLKKKEFSLEEIYTNKNFHEPPDGRLETIFEVPVSGRDGSVSFASQRRKKRFVEFPEVGMPRKPRRPVIKSGVSRKAVKSLNLARTRRGGYDRTEEGGVRTLQDIEAILCSKLEQLDIWIALEEDGLSV